MARAGWWPRPRHGRTELACGVALTAIWILLIALVRPTGDFPLNDDWVYARSVQSILKTGQFSLVDTARAAGLPQAYWGALFCVMSGFSYIALRASTLVLGLVGILFTYHLLRECGATPRAALLGALAIAVNPLYLNLSSTFMTDVPFYAGFVAALFLLVRGFHRQSVGWLTLGLVAAGLATFTRAYGVVLLAGYALAYIWSRPKTVRHVLTAIGPLVLAGLGTYALSRWLQAHGRIPLPEASFVDTIASALRAGVLSIGRRVCAGAVYTGLFVIPSAWLAVTSARALSVSTHRWGAWIRAAAAVALVAAACISPTVRVPGLGNVLDTFGLGPLTLRDTFLLGLNLPRIPAALEFAWLVATGLAILSAALLVGRTWDAATDMLGRVRARGLHALGPVPILLATTAAGYALTATALMPTMFERYLLPCAPLAMVLLSLAPSPQAAPARQPPAMSGLRWLTPLPWALVALTAAFSVVAMRDYLDWNRARWNALTYLTDERGVPATAIDGGYEFNGARLYVSGGEGSQQPGKSWWWVIDDDYVVASGPIPGYAVIASFPFERRLPSQHARIVVLKRQ